MSNSSIKIQPIPESRWKEGRDLRLEALREEPLAFGSSYEEEEKLTEQEWKERNKNAVYAMDNDMTVGMVVTIYQSHTKAKHIANIFALYVKKSHRGRGIGHQLIEHVIQKLKETGTTKKIRLTVNREQTAAIGLYKKFGFEEVGILKNELFYEGSYYDELIMEQHLEDSIESI